MRNNCATLWCFEILLQGNPQTRLPLITATWASLNCQKMSTPPIGYGDVIKVEDFGFSAIN